MRIAFVIPDILPGGPANVVLAIAIRLAVRHDVHVFTFRARADGDLTNQFITRGVHVHALPGRWVSQCFGFASPVAKAILRLKPDIVNLHGLRPTLLGLTLPVESVATVHSIVREDFIMEYGKNIARIAWPVYRIALKRANSVTAVSGGVGSFLQGEAVPSRVIYNGVSRSEWQPPSKDQRSHARMQFNVQTKYVASVVGRLIERKNVSAAIDAISRLPMARDTTVLVAGDGPLREALETQASRLYHTGLVIRFLGAVSDVRSVYWASDLLVSMSFSEGAPMGVLEAIGSGVPVVLSKISPHQEIADSGVGRVLLCDLDGSTCLSHEVVSALEAPYQGGDLPLENSRYDADSAAKNYEAEFKRVVREKRTTF